ncbi:hypothetical protein ACVIU7_005494 [Bradyrhizobium liaoningense]
MIARSFDLSGKTVAECDYSEFGDRHRAARSTHPWRSLDQPRSTHCPTRAETRFALKTLEDCTSASGPVNEPRTVAGRP